MWLILAACAGSAQATTRASLDRHQAALGETITLSIDSDQGAATPDLSPLLADFSIEGQSVNRSMQWVNGNSQSMATYVLQLSPKREGVLVIPAIKLGNDLTAPLSLRVTASASTPAGEGSDAFFETVVDDPYPIRASKRRRGGGLKYAPGGQWSHSDWRRRRTPRCSSWPGPLLHGQIGATHTGRAASLRIDPGAQRPVGHSGARSWAAAPATGWPVCSAVAARYTGPRRSSHHQTCARALQCPAALAAVCATCACVMCRSAVVARARRPLVVESIARGATGTDARTANTSWAGAQVFAEPPQYEETVVDGTPQVTLTRRYSLVPNGAGTLLVPGLKLAWWDVRAGAAKTASLPDLELKVARGVGGFASNTLPDVAAVAGSASGAPADAADRAHHRHVWAWLAVLSPG